MATATRKLFVNLATKQLQISDLNGGAFVLPAFQKYENVPFEVVFVEPDLEAVGLPAWARIDISNLSISVALNDTFDDASPLAYQNTFSKDETLNVFSGSLSLNTTALNTWIGSSDSKSAYFEIELSEGTNVIKAYQTTVTVKNSVSQINATVPSPVDEYYTKAQTSAQFVQKVMPAGEQITITSPGGVYQRVLGVDDGGNLIDQVLPV